MPTPLEEALNALLTAVRGATSGESAGPEAPGQKPADEPQDVLAGINDANAKVRETAKWMATSFAAIGGVLIGGLGLSSLGKLTGNTPDERVAAAVTGLVFGIVGIGIAIWFTSRVLSPFLNTFRSADEHPKITAEVLGDGEILGGHDYEQLKAKITSLRAKVKNTTGPEKEKARQQLEGWEQTKRLALGVVGSRLLDCRFQAARVAIVSGFSLAAAGVGLFAWGANPPKDASKAPVALSQAPVRQRIQLTDRGVAALKRARGCERSYLTALAIAGREGSREVITVPSGRCRSVRFMLTPELGTATAAGRQR